MKSRKIVLIGGGSRLWTPRLVRDMLQQPALAGCEYVLYDPNPAATRLVAGVLELLRREFAPKARIVIEPNTARAFTGADAFVITVAVGGFGAMAHDIAVPEKFGIYHTVGDTSGPGGWARALRNIPVFGKFAVDIERYAPRALVLNYTNPMTVLTQVLAQRCRAPVVGLCHGLFENLDFFQRVYGLKSETELSVRYAGLNHFFWMLAARAGEKDLLADLERRLEARSLHEIYPDKIADPIGFHSQRHVADDLYRRTGSMCYIGDRHTSEFLPHFITDRATMEKYHLRRTPVAWRKKRLKEQNATLHRWIARGLPDEMRRRSRETAADILGARFTGQPFTDVGNVPNIGQIDNLPRGLVVETPVVVDRNGFTPVAMGAMPAPVLALLEPWAHTFTQTLQAGLEGDRALALRALRLDPVCSHLTTAQVRDLGERLLQANHRHTSYLR